MLDKMSLNMCELCTSLYFNTLKNFIQVFSDSPFLLHHKSDVDNANMKIFSLPLFVNLCQNYEIGNFDNMQIKNMKWKVISRKSRFVNKAVVPRLFTRNYETTTYMKQILASIYLPSAATLDFEKGQNILER